MEVVLVRSVSRVLIIAGLALANLVVLAQTQRPAIGVIQGIVQSGGTPIPGVAVTATNSMSGEKVTTSTDPNGQYQLKVAGTGTYSIEAAMAGFAPATKPVELQAGAPARLDLELTLASRSQQAAAQPAPAVGFRGRGAQRLQVQQTGQAEPQDQQAQTDDLTAQVQPDLATPGLAADAPTESVAVLGNTAETTFGNNNFNFDRQQIQQFIDQQFGGQGGQPGNQNGGNFDGGGRGGRGGGGGGNFNPGGRGNRGGGGRGGFALGRGGRGFGATAPRGNLSYQFRGSVLDAAPYSLTGQATTQPQYTQNNFSATVGGPMVIPHIIKDTNTSYNFSYNGTRNQNPVDNYYTVPTLLERQGDFSQTTIRNGANAGNLVQIFNPATSSAFQNNAIPTAMLNSAAVGLLKYIPLPNQSGDIQNFHFVTTPTTDSNNFNFGFNHTFANAQQQQGRGQRGNFQNGRGGGGGGRGGGRGRGSNISFRVNLTSQNSQTTGAFPTVGGSSETKGIQVQFGYTRPLGRINNSFNTNYNRNHRTATNLYAFQQDIEGALGIAGVSTNPFDWGLPNLTFTNFQSLNDTRASLRIDQTWQFSDTMNFNRSRHSMRWGADVRITDTQVHTTQNSRGTFTFTGARTAAVDATGVPLQGTGLDFADFLLGLPQQTTLQSGAPTYNFRGPSFDVFWQDDWRLRGKFTVQYGLRYDYASPYTEKNNQLVNLDIAPGFTAVVPVLAGQTGPYHSFPRSLVKPDRNMFSPRLGFAMTPKSGTVVRAAYGINFNGAAYATIASQMSNQPPFSIAQTNIFSSSLPLSLQNGFPVATGASVTNNYGIDPNYRIGYAQTWNLDLQQDLKHGGLVLSLDYTGTKGTRLDVLEAPNRTATGLRLASVQPFNFETSEGNSILHSGAIRLNRRLGRGVGFGGTYQFSKSIDDASTVSGGGGGGIVAQDAFNLRAERGPSSFDIRHRLSVNYNWELPFGTSRPFLSEPSVWKGIFGDWLLNGNFNVTSGVPLTIHVLGSYTDVNRGSNGSLRADATGASPVRSNPTVAQWFNTAAFTVPAAGTFGNVGRNTVRGPGQIGTNLTIQKTFMFSDGRSINVQAQASNFLNHPAFNPGGVDTNVNSITFGRVTSVGQMRRVVLQTRFNF